jgi:hypothetical protein
MEKNVSLEEELMDINAKLAEEGLSFIEKCELKDRQHNIKMKLNGVKPQDSHIDCIGCGS